MADGAITRACTAQQPRKGICGAVAGSCAHDAPSPPPGGLVCHGAGRKERTGLGSVPAANPCLSARQICELLVPSVPIRPIPSPISHPTPPPVPLRPSCRLPCVVLSALAPLFLPPGSPRFFGINRIRAGEGTDLPHLVLQPSSPMYRGQIRMPAGSGACHPPVALAAPHSLALVRFRP